MSWKAYKKTISVVTMTAVAAVLIGCSSQKKPSTIKASAYNEDAIKFGAKYKNRQFMPDYMHFANGRISLNAAPVNQRDFLQQLSNVRAYSSLANSYATTYGKVSRWISSGANINDLAKYGINTRLMRGEDGYQNVLMTGYYSPVIQARRTPQGQFQHPIHAMPANKRFTRAQIYAGALDGQGLELAYSNSMLENFLLGVQGSGYIDFGNGNLNYFAYAGQNGFKYASVGRLLVEDGEIPKEKMSIQAIRDWGKRNPYRVQELLERNPSYVFFKNDPSGQVKGSAGVPLVALASVASDRSIVPSGSVLLVEMPLIDDNGNWTGRHEMRLMVALDVGGAIKGHHFDLYQGIGERAGHVAGLMKHYGRVWVLN